MGTMVYVYQDTLGDKVTKAACYRLDNINVECH